MREPLTPLADCEWVPGKRVTALAKLGLTTLGELVRHYPRRYEDRRSFAGFPDSAMETPVCLTGNIAAASLKRFGYRRGAYEITLENGTGSAFSQPVICRWFNMPYMQKALMVGDSVVIYGKPKMRGKQVVIDHPEYEVLDDEDNSLHMKRIVPIHAAGEGVTTRVLRTLIHEALDVCDLGAAGFLRSAGMPLETAFRDIHFPENQEAADLARERLAVDECYAMQVVVQTRRSAWVGLEGEAKVSRGVLSAKLISQLPFALTASQQSVIAEIQSDLAAPRRMNRLLQGDVGSGKTLVAVAAMVQTIEAGFPAAIMAPTQILAEQHHATLTKLLEPLGIPVYLRTGSRKTNGRSDEASPTICHTPPATPGLPPAIVGTHALLFEDETTFRPGLIVIDEQHKFGVIQRSKLTGLPSRPDVLVMTATPIPRTLTQTVYGDLDVSILREKPEGRGVIRTAVRPVNKLPEVADFIRKHLENGRQAYIVYPLIDETEKLAAKAASEEFVKWGELMAPFSVGLLHGRTAADDKERAMEDFRAGRLSVLVSTTVIEVGVDVPNASILLVENAERFGLAQLHQLRGRIGRGTHKSFCVLLHSKDAPDDALAKLAVLERTRDGFIIAEEDLRLRGPGNVLGTAQTGLPPLKITNIVKDSRVMAEAAAQARQTLSVDPGLRLPENQNLRSMVDRAMESALAASG
ncbi:MAG: ATP-dependent DNA helicase RecG [Terrimicrobiaceae bacterium]